MPFGFVFQDFRLESFSLVEILMPPACPPALEVGEGGKGVREGGGWAREVWEDTLITCPTVQNLEKQV